MIQADNFLLTLNEYYRTHARDLPWRQPEPDGSFDAYKILVSEIMLQQTQVSRVVPKYRAFLESFPTIQELAAAPLPEVLASWSGLGYNRRAKYLLLSAQNLTRLPQPWSLEALESCPGIGRNTAAAVVAYSYNVPALFVETNIRTVIIHHFFADEGYVSDKQILEILTQITPQALKTMTPRNFYWAMMDYGTFLKSTVGNLNKQSKTYAKQSAFHGSSRQIRGQVIKLLLDGPVLLKNLEAYIPDSRLTGVITQLEREQLVKFQGNTLMLYNETSKSING